MNIVIRKTRACTFDTLDIGLKAAIRAHATKFGLVDLEFDILMCCETITVYPRKGFFWWHNNYIIGCLCHAEMVGMG